MNRLDESPAALQGMAAAIDEGTLESGIVEYVRRMFARYASDPEQRPALSAVLEAACRAGSGLPLLDELDWMPPSRRNAAAVEAFRAAANESPEAAALYLRKWGSDPCLAELLEELLVRGGPLLKKQLPPIIARHHPDVDGVISRLEEVGLEDDALAVLGRLPAVQIEDRLRAQWTDKAGLNLRRAFGRSGVRLLLGDASASARREWFAERVGKAKVLPSWTRLLDLESVCWSDGEPVDEPTLRFALARQKALGTVVDPEAWVLFEGVDHTGFAFARTLVAAWKAAGEPKAHGWVLVVLAAFGGDSAVPSLHSFLRGTLRRGDQARALRGVEALVAIGSDAALSVLADIEGRWADHAKRRHRVAGEACRTVLLDQSYARGIPLDELTELCVPTLGLDPDGRQALDGGRFELRLADDGQLNVHRIGVDTPLKSVPRSADPAVRQEVIELRALSKKLFASWARRFERAMVDRKSWSATAFRERVLAHPLLGTVVKSLLFVVDGQAGRPEGAWLVDRDGALLPEGRVSVLHPAELTDDERSAWRVRHASEQVFLQLARPVHGAVQRESFVGRRLGSPSVVAEIERGGWSSDPWGTSAAAWRLFAGFGLCLYVDFLGGLDPRNPQPVTVAGIRLLPIVASMHGRPFDPWSLDEAWPTDLPPILASEVSLALEQLLGQT